MSNFVIELNPVEPEAPVYLGVIATASGTRCALFAHQPPGANHVVLDVKDRGQLEKTLKHERSNESLAAYKEAAQAKMYDGPPRFLEYRQDEAIRVMGSKELVGAKCPMLRKMLAVCEVRGGDAPYQEATVNHDNVTGRPYALPVNRLMINGTFLPN